MASAWALAFFECRLLEVALKIEEEEEEEDEVYNESRRNRKKKF